MTTARLQDTFPVAPPELVYARYGNPLRTPDGKECRPALFLDRDGVINEDVGYLHRIEDLVVQDGIAARIGDARRKGCETVIVTNQSGIGRGYYGWEDFMLLQAEIDRRLQAEDPEAVISFVCACPFHPKARQPYAVSEHPWRKPNPGMLTFAAEILDIDLSKSLMIGDSAGDETAAQRCGVAFEYYVDMKDRRAS